MPIRLKDEEYDRRAKLNEALAAQGLGDHMRAHGRTQDWINAWWKQGATALWLRGQFSAVREMVEDVTGGPFTGYLPE
jgi:hypothetical protein